MLSLSVCMDDDAIDVRWVRTISTFSFSPAIDAAHGSLPFLPITLLIEVTSADLSDDVPT